MKRQNADVKGMLLRGREMTKLIFPSLEFIDIVFVEAVFPFFRLYFGLVLALSTVHEKGNKRNQRGVTPPPLSLSNYAGKNETAAFFFIQ